MALDTSIANNKKAKARGKQAPPAGTFWRKYSAHHEFPLSLSSSIFLHIIGFVCLAGLVFGLMGLGGSMPMPVGVVRVGGGGNPLGVGTNPGDGVIPSSEAITEKDKPQPESVSKSVDTEPLAKPEPKKPELTLTDKSGLRPVEADTSVPDSRLSAIGNKARAVISGHIAGKGLGGSGSGGGQGSGKGTGIGNASGPGRGSLNQREKRQLRWTMIFNTRNGNDYANQLMGLGAILAILGPDGEYLVIRDLTRRPVQMRVEDLKELNRIYWIDDKPQSVHSLSMALGIRPVPDHIVAFFPVDLENQLRQKEMERFRGNEDDIKETIFQVQQRGNRYEPVVTEVKRR